MPKFVVTRGRDAWIMEEAIIEAESAATANDRASRTSVASLLDWKQNGEILVFDHADYFPDDTSPLEDGVSLEDYKTLSVTGKQRDAILAGLRLLYEALQKDELPSNMIMEIYSDGGSHDGLTVDAIDELCEAINV